MTPQDIITAARSTLNDTTSGAYRQADTELLGYVNAGIKECALLRPELFAQIGDITCDQGTVEQSLLFDDALALLEVLCVHEGNSLTPFDLATMNAFRPGWRADAEGPAEQWTRFPDDPLRFYIYPPAPYDQVLDVRYVQTPAAYALGDTITELPDTALPALTQYVVSRSESKDAEHVSSGRAKASYDNFVALLKV